MPFAFFKPNKIKIAYTIWWRFRIEGKGEPIQMELMSNLIEDRKSMKQIIDLMADSRDYICK